MRLLVVALLGTLGCATSSSERAAEQVVTQYLHAVRNNQPRRAYSLLSRDVRRNIDYTEFERQWRESSNERRRQAGALARLNHDDYRLALAGTAELGHGAIVFLDSTSRGWKVRSLGLAGPLTPRPKDAVRALEAALKAGNFSPLLAILAKERGDSVRKRLQALLSSLRTHRDHHIQQWSDTRAEMAWEDKRGRYRLRLVLEDKSWRVDDIEITLLGAEEPEANDTAECVASDPLCGL